MLVERERRGVFDAHAQDERARVGYFLARLAFVAVDPFLRVIVSPVVVDEEVEHREAHVPEAVPRSVDERRDDAVTCAFQTQRAQQVRGEFYLFLRPLRHHIRAVASYLRTSLSKRCYFYVAC